jgi:hypothetical protein
MPPQSGNAHPSITLGIYPHDEWINTMGKRLVQMYRYFD